MNEARAKGPALAPLAEEAGAKPFRIDPDVPARGWAILSGDQVWLWAVGLRPLQPRSPDAPYTYEVWVASPEGRTAPLGAVGPAPGGAVLATFQTEDPAPAAVLLTVRTRLEERPLSVILTGRLRVEPAEVAEPPPTPEPALTGAEEAHAPRPAEIRGPDPVHDPMSEKAYRGSAPFPPVGGGSAPGMPSGPALPLANEPAESPPAPPEPAETPPSGPPAGPAPDTGATGEPEDLVPEPAGLPEAAGAGVPSSPPGEIPESPAAPLPAEAPLLPPGTVPLETATVALEPQGNVAAGARGSAQLDFRAGALLVTLRGMPRPEELGRSQQTGRPYNSYRIWLHSSGTRELLSPGVAARVWSDTYRLQVKEGVPLRRFDSLSVTAEDRAGSAGRPSGPMVLAGRYRWYKITG